jgi:hypothetical protein
MPADARHLDKNGVTVITALNLADAVAGDIQTAQKLGIQNIGDRVLNTMIDTIAQVGSNAGWAQLRIGLDVTTLSCPFGVTAVELVGSGVWGATGAYGWVVVAENGTGLTGPSLEVTFNVTNAGNRVTLAWTAVAGATNYRAYRTPTPGTYGATTLVYSGAATTFNDTGVAPTSGTPPTENTTAGAGPNYGTPPVLSTAPITFGNIAIDQQKFYWVNRVIPVSTPAMSASAQLVPAES